MSRIRDVKAVLTPEVENQKFAQFVRRIIRAHSRRVADGDVEALADLLGLSNELSEAIQSAVDGLRESYSWAEIGGRVGMSRQAAQGRWGAKHPRVFRHASPDMFAQEMLPCFAEVGVRS